MIKLYLIKWPENLILLPVYVTLYSVWQHDSGTECTPGESKNLGQKENGNYIMYARATSGDKLNNNKFSLCSIRNISQVLEKKRNNCFVGTYIFSTFYYEYFQTWKNYVVNTYVPTTYVFWLTLCCICFITYLCLSIPQSIFFVAVWSGLHQYPSPLNTSAYISLEFSVVCDSLIFLHKRNA